LSINTPTTTPHSFYNEEYSKYNFVISVAVAFVQ